MAKWYGNLDNRISEGRTVKEIKQDMDITMYYWSDRRCYYVTDVINQKDIKVASYQVCADKEKDICMGHQDWKYFKTLADQKRYLNRFIKNEEEKYLIDESDFEPTEQEWVFRYNKWKRKIVYTKEDYNPKYPGSITKRNGSSYTHLTEKEIEDLKQGKDIIRYEDLSGKISFGVRDYYHDRTF